MFGDIAPHIIIVFVGLRHEGRSSSFHLTRDVALVVSVIIALLRFDPIQIVFWVNVLQGLLSPILVVLVILVANNAMIMRKFTNTLITNIILGVTVLVMITATILFFIGLATGSGGDDAGGGVLAVETAPKGPARTGSGRVSLTR